MLDAENPSADRAISAVQPRPQSIRLELYMDSYRATGDVACGAARRPVDALNMMVGQFVGMRCARVDDPFNEEYKPQDFDVIQLHRNGILIAVPRDELPCAADPFEAVKKVPVPSTIVLPGFAVTGNVFHIPEADPGRVPIVGNSNFLPVTDASLTVSRGRTHVWREPLVIVNLARVLLYAPHREGAGIGPHGPGGTPGAAPPVPRGDNPDADGWL